MGKSRFIESTIKVRGIGFFDINEKLNYSFGSYFISKRDSRVQLNILSDDVAAKNIRLVIAEQLQKKVTPPCQRILLIHPQQIEEQDFFIDTAIRGRYWAYPPYGCGVLARNLENRGYQTDILDLNLELLKEANEKKRNFVYGFWEHSLTQRLDDFRPDMVGISCMFSMSHNIIKDISKKIREYNPNIPIIIGGVHPTNSKKLILGDCPDIDFLSIYECDRSLPDLIDFLNKKLEIDSLAQIGVVIDGQLLLLESRATPTAVEIDTIPLYHNLPIDSYYQLGQVGTYGFLRKDRPASSILSNRGCRAHCSFCNVPAFNGRIVRGRSVQSVIDEIRKLYDMGIRHIEWLDDDFLYDSKRVLSLLNAIVDLKLDLTWSASNGLIAAAITEEIMEAMVASGCLGFNLGIESGNPEILRSIHKPGTVDSFRKCKKIADKYPHVFIKGFLILGFPDETLSQILDTVNLSLELQLDWYSIQILNPLPSTEIYDSMVRQGLIQDALNTNKSAYVYGPNGRQRLKEERERLTASEFFNLFGICKPEEVPQQEQLGDYLFLMDYKINYEIILSIDNHAKLINKDVALADICERIAPESALAQLFFGVTRKKLGDHTEASKRAAKVKMLITESAYWKKRFDVLELYTLLDSIC